MSKLILEVEGKKYPLTNSTFNSYNRGAGPEAYPTDNTFTIQIKITKLNRLTIGFIMLSDKRRTEELFSSMMRRSRYTKFVFWKRRRLASTEI